MVGGLRQNLYTKIIIFLSFLFYKIVDVQKTSEDHQNWEVTLSLPFYVSFHSVFSASV